MMPEEDVCWVEDQCMCSGIACAVCERRRYAFYRADPTAYDHSILPEGLVPRDGD